ncbi:MAG: nucleotidyltransferase domain-containing protein [Planctomycetota bacterium]|jgi:hypothetical protein
MMVPAHLDSWLIALSDPCGAGSGVPDRPLTKGAMRRLVTLADAHGVLAALVANLQQLANQGGAEQILRANRSAGETAEQFQTILTEAAETLRQRAGLSLLIRSQLAELSGVFASRSIPCVVLKGSEFADRLYPDAAFRPFTDLDLLVPPDAVGEAEDAMRSLDYLPKATAMKYDAGYGERGFSRSSTPGAAVEIHWNLVNSPTLRKGISVSYNDLQFERRSSGEGGLDKLSASSLLLIAAVHAAVSHCFDRLQLLCDIRQAVRGAAGEIDTEWLSEAIGRTGSSLAMASALGLTGKILGEPRCRPLSEKLKLDRRSAAWKLLLTRGVVLRAHAGIDSFRRCLFRVMLKRRT